MHELGYVIMPLSLSFKVFGFTFGDFFELCSVVLLTDMCPPNFMGFLMHDIHKIYIKRMHKVKFQYIFFFLDIDFREEKNSLK